jgi:hypothetical protein
MVAVAKKRDAHCRQIVEFTSNKDVITRYENVIKSLGLREQGHQ